ncbi:MAG: DsbA family protein [Rubellimicrobium sp.]|nr:DsbA family protein [Rubellimicrobium sp.]
MPAPFRPFRPLLAAGPLVAALAAGAAHAEAAPMSDSERETLRAEVRAYLLENPEVLMEAIAVLEQRQTRAQAMADQSLVETNLASLVDDGYSFVGGNPDGDITVVEFMDYRCGYCRRAFPEVEALLSGDGNIRFVVKEYPILGAQSDLAARFAIAVQRAYGDETYKDVHDALMQFTADLTPETLDRLATGFGLDPAVITAGMDAPEVNDIIGQNRALGDVLGITGTPTFVIGGRMVRGYVPLDQMLRIVGEERAG